MDLQKLKSAILALELKLFTEELQNMEMEGVITRTERNAILRTRCREDFECFGQLVLHRYFKKPFSSMHRDFCEAERNPARRRRREVIAAPRGHGKTTFKVTLKVLHAIAYGYEPYIMILTHSGIEAKKRVRDILKELETNENFIEVYGPLAPVRGQFKGVARYGSDSFVTQNGIFVEAKSRGTQLRGARGSEARPTLVICDDLESSSRVLKEEQRHKTKDWFDKDVLQLGEADGSMNLIIIGTRMHEKALLSELLERPGWQSKKYQAVLNYASNQALWKEWEALFTNNADPNAEATAQAFYEANEAALLEGSSVLWPDGESYLELMKTRLTGGIASFYSEKQNDPFDPERQIFDMEAAKRVRLEFVGEKLANIHWLDGSGKVVPAHHLARIVAFHDPSMGDVDYGAIVVVAEDLDGNYYCLDAYLKKSKPSAQLEQAYLLHKKWGFDALYLETNNFQRLLEQGYRDLRKQYPESHLRVIAVTQHQNKIKRIGTMLEPLITCGRLLFAESLPELLMSQLRLFPTDSHDDGPDALHGAIEQLRHGQSSVTFFTGNGVFT